MFTPPPTVREENNYLSMTQRQFIFQPGCALVFEMTLTGEYEVK